MAVTTTAIRGRVRTADGRAFKRGSVKATLSQTGRAVDGETPVLVARVAVVSWTGDAEVALDLVPNEAISPTGTTYTLEWSTIDERGRRDTWADRVVVPVSDAPVSFADLVRVAAPAAAFVAGPVGPRGPQGDRGPAGVDGAASPTVDLKRDFQAKGDGTLDDAAFARLVAYLPTKFGTGANGTRAQRMDIAVPPGRYLISPSTLGNFENVRFVGPSRELCIFECSDPTQTVRANIDHADGITFRNVVCSGYAPFAPQSVRYRGCRFELNDAVSDPSLTIVNGSPVVGGDVEIDHCDWAYPRAYVGLRIYRARNATVRNCSFKGDASHAVRVEAPVPGGAIVIAGCNVKGGKTGIFFPSDRLAPIENVLVERCQLDGVREEGIAFDGLGNNYALVPTIANGTIASATNRADGRLVITPSLVHHTGVAANVPLPVSGRDDWTTYRFTFGYGSGLAGVIARIVDFDSTSLTLDIFAPASEVTPGGDCGVQAGFFGATVRDNIISGGYGTSYTPSLVTGATAISMYLNVFGARVTENTIYGCGAGIRLVGGKQLATYDCLAYNNVIEGNTLHQVARLPWAGCGPIVLETTYSGRPQYGNRVRFNRIYGGECSISGQGDTASVWGTNDLLAGATLRTA